MAVSCWITSSPLQKFPPLSTSSFQLQTSYHHLRLHSCSSSINFLAEPLHCSNRVFRKRFLRHSRDLRVRCNSETPSNLSGSSDSTSIQVYRDFERLVTETVKQSQDAWGGASNWSEVEGAWVLGPTHSKPWSIVHFIGGIFVGAAPQLAYRSFLERLCEKGILVIATPYASGFDHFSIADEVQFKFDRCLRSLQETVGDLPTFGIGHSLGSVVHLLIGSRYAVQRNGNVFMAFNNKLTGPKPSYSIVFTYFSPYDSKNGAPSVTDSIIRDGAAWLVVGRRRLAAGRLTVPPVAAAGCLIAGSSCSPLRGSFDEVEVLFESSRKSPPRRFFFYAVVFSVSPSIPRRR
ncbi:hypothetical protein SOVF_098050 isoform A [Spinacia oleracea]|nr:hypothetical protein SOVF_098050 isoform A [Spinacia oleracea]